MGGRARRLTVRRTTSPPYSIISSPAFSGSRVYTPSSAIALRRTARRAGARRCASRNAACRRCFDSGSDAPEPVSWRPSGSTIGAAGEPPPAPAPAPPLLPIEPLRTAVARVDRARARLAPPPAPSSSPLPPATPAAPGAAAAAEGPLPPSITWHDDSTRARSWSLSSPSTGVGFGSHACATSRRRPAPIARAQPRVSAGGRGAMEEAFAGGAEAAVDACPFCFRGRGVLAPPAALLPPSPQRLRGFVNGGASSVAAATCAWGGALPAAAACHCA
jgi:hypothetical protein